MKKNVTRNDVAKLAGVSPAVVSYVINQSKNVREEKAIAVKKAIEELQYKPNRYARSLKTNRSMQIAFVCDNLRNDWLEIAEKEFFEKGYFVSHCYTRDGDDFIQMLIEDRFDGVFMLSNRYTADQLNQIARAGIPVVLYKSRDYSFLEPNIVAVAPNIYDGVVKTVNYLVFRGHKRIMYIPPLRYKMNIKNGFREKAYKEAMEMNGLGYDESYICWNTDNMDIVLEKVFELVFNRVKEERITAVMAGTDYIAAIVMQYAKKLGLNIPQDLAVVGVDNTYLAEVVTPRLTSVDFSKEIFSQKLVETMLKLINGEIPDDQIIDVSLCVRDST